MPTPPVRPVSAQLTEETGNGVQTEAHSRGFVVVYENLEGPSSGIVTANLSVLCGPNMR